MSLLTGLLSFVLIAFSIWATIDILLTRQKDIRNFHKIFWLVISVVFGAFAGLSWLWVGRPRKVGLLPGGNTGTVAQLAANAGITIPGVSAPVASDRPSEPTAGQANDAGQASFDDLAPEVTEAKTVIDLTEPVDAQPLPPAPLGPEDSEGWAQWSTIALAEDQFKED